MPAVTRARQGALRAVWSEQEVRAVARGTLVAAPLLLLFGALLAAADVAFEDLVLEAVDLDPEALGHAFWALFVAWVAAGLLTAALPARDPGAPRVYDRFALRRTEGFFLGSVEIFVALYLPDALFLVFVPVQARYLFGGADGVTSVAGLAHAEYARRSFLELVAVTALVLPVLLVDHWIFRPEGRPQRRTFNALRTTMVALLGVIWVPALCADTGVVSSYRLLGNGVYDAANVRSSRVAPAHAGRGGSGPDALVGASAALACREDLTAGGRLGIESDGGGIRDMKPGTRVLVVEDDRSICRLVELQLGHRDFVVRCAHDGLSGLEAAEGFRPDVVILDIMLPGLDGVGVLKRLRRGGSRVPVIMLTARNATPDKVHSLGLGADDYLTKPFDVKELVARLGALVRRAQGDEVLRFAYLEVDTAAREARRGGRSVDLTNREYELLEFMARNPRRVLSRDLLLERVWGGELGFGTKVVDVYVGYLRKKVDGPGETPLIRTVRGAGYALKDG